MTSEMELDERRRRIEMFAGENRRLIQVGQFMIDYTVEEQNQVFARLLERHIKDGKSKLDNILIVRKVLEDFAQLRGYEDELAEMLVVDSLAISFQLIFEDLPDP